MIEGVLNVVVFSVEQSASPRDPNSIVGLIRLLSANEFGCTFIADDRLITLHCLHAIDLLDSTFWDNDVVSSPVEPVI